MSRKARGQYGETLARDYLTKRGYDILHKNWRFRRYGEIDLIAYSLEQQHLAFVEVKTRYQNSYGSPLEAVSLAQQRKIKIVAEAYLAQHPPTHPFKSVSLDLITITPNPIQFNPPIVQHYPNAF